MFLFVKSIHIKNRENKTQFKMIETDTKQIFEKTPQKPHTNIHTSFKRIIE